MLPTFLVLLLSIHPFHVSVADIKYKEDQKAIQVSMRIFLDDLEEGLQKYSGNEKLNITEEAFWTEVNSSLKEYLLKKVRILDAKDRLYELKYIGAEIDEDVMWCYLEVEKVRSLKKVTVFSDVLTEVYGDQENLIHFRAFDKVKSARLGKAKPVSVFEWSE